MEQNAVAISCLCGAAQQSLNLTSLVGSWPHVPICHCDSCRRLTGVLCTSYVAISTTTPPTPSVVGLRSYDAPSPHSGACRYFFCATCGCHVFRCFPAPHGDETLAWEVATGVIADSPEPGPSLVSSGGERDHKSVKAWQHLNVDDTRDGGLSIWIPGLGNAAPVQGIGAGQDRGPKATIVPDNDHGETQPAAAPEDDYLRASCHCSAVSFCVTRPDAVTSTAPRSNFPDLMLAYCSTPPEVFSNPGDEKWWLRGGPLSAPSLDPSSSRNDTPRTQMQQSPGTTTKYLAGTCACRSCRLTSGFEIQPWAFIPRGNILFLSGIPGTFIPLDFNHPPPALQRYTSSPGVAREFCHRCGATVFWHDVFRPELVDVSTGLLRAESEGARATGWLVWWTERVSFAEEAGKGRRAAGMATLWARDLVDALASGMRVDGSSREGVAGEMQSTMTVSSVVAETDIGS
ncbi:Mss4-like protein [Lasiosphaeria miniovina]|uniref:Mss4-like protein n=1 Tax=Lasiosphaeria miniovina TaxID=1954250 RepID=A0AA40AJX6_9PEZI|nr:Mss4-like protein [Lasiosphaeria miniovina]KAK0717248.1 Mss4-like protein [Lasiosphaeria miniovina]